MEALIPEGAKRGCAVFAHPDDESLWCGGLLATSALDWTVICCSIPEKDPERAYKFFAACKVLGVTGQLLPFGEKAGLFRLDLIDLTGFDLVLTHGPAGEYGHPQHRELHDRLFRHCPVPLRTIGYREGGMGRFAYPLDTVARHTKIEALKCYDHKSTADDGKIKFEALIDYYGARFDLWTETYD